MGPAHVTSEVAAALRSIDYVVAAEKTQDGDTDELLAARQAILDEYAGDTAVQIVAVPDPKRDRSENLTTQRYQAAVNDWHRARAVEYGQVLADRGGTAGFLVWGDPSLYDSTIRIVEYVRDLGTDLEVEVLPGISAPQVLAARHAMVLHDVGEPIHLTTGRRLRQAVAAGQENIVSMLNPPPEQLDLTGIDDWTIWWGANLGATGERLVSGRLADVMPAVVEARRAAREDAGWVMDVFRVRKP